MSAPDDKTTYTVHAHRWARGWELHIDGVGVTQSRTLNDAEAMARDYIALDTGAQPASFNVEILPQIDGLDEEARAARRAVIDAERARDAAAALSRDVARKLSRAGLSGREIAVVLKVSPQRVSQLLAGLGVRGKVPLRRTAARSRRGLSAPPTPYQLPQKGPPPCPCSARPSCPR